MDADSVAETERLHPFPVVAAIIGLAALAIAHPVLDLMARQPEFLVAHGLSPMEVVLLAIALVSVPGLALSLVGWAGRLRPRTQWITGVALGLPTVLLALHLARNLPLPATAVAGMALAAAVLVPWFFLRTREVRDASRYLVVVPLVVGGYFLTVLPSSVLASPDGASDVALEDVGNPIPVVVLVLDELPVASLMAADGSLLEEQFPSFGRLAADGVWYRNAITVETRTTESIPAVLSGRAIPDGLVPNANDHPRTLFTLLSSSHDVDGVEPVTDLCPVEVCRQSEATDPSWSDRWGTLLKDLAIVYTHLVAPARLSDRLPPVDQAWTGFAPAPAESWDLVEAVGQAVEADRRGEVAHFLASVEAVTDRPPLRVAHLTLPHRPWEFLPDGTRHGQENVEGYGGRGWGPDEYFVADGWRRHLLQVGYVDSVVGATISAMEERGLYDAGLVVVVADHGVHFQPDVADMRVTNEQSIGSILPVPLFIKYPTGLPGAPAPGTVDDTRAETVDIVPTVLEVLAAPLPDGLDGVSLLGTEASARTSSDLELRGELVDVGVEGVEKIEMARLKADWFPHGDVWRLVPSPELASLLDQPLEGFRRSDDPGIRLDFDDQTPSPPLVEGQVSAPGGLEGDEVVVLTVDGRIRALTKVLGGEASTGRFSFLVDPARPFESAPRAWLLTDGSSLTE